MNTFEPTEILTIIYIYYNFTPLKGGKNIEKSPDKYADEYWIIINKQIL